MPTFGSPDQFTREKWNGIRTMDKLGRYSSVVVSDVGMRNYPARVPVMPGRIAEVVINCNLGEAR